LHPVAAPSVDDEINEAAHLDDGAELAAVNPIFQIPGGVQVNALASLAAVHRLMEADAAGGKVVIRIWAGPSLG
jgi:hypothetical protein